MSQVRNILFVFGALATVGVTLLLSQDYGPAEGDLVEREASIPVEEHGVHGSASGEFDLLARQLNQSRVAVGEIEPAGELDAHVADQAHESAVGGDESAVTRVADRETHAIRLLISELNEERMRVYRSIHPVTKGAYKKAFDRGDYLVLDKIPKTEGKLISVRPQEDGYFVVTLPREGFSEAYALLDQFTSLGKDIKAIRRDLHARSLLVRGR